MSSYKFLENKQLIHIAGETLILMAIVYYFSRKFKSVNNNFKSLIDKINSLETIIDNQNKAITALMSQRQMVFPRSHDFSPPNKQQKEKTHVEKTVSFSEPEKEKEIMITEDDSDDSDSDSVLDDEIKEELNELKNSQNTD